MKLEKLHDILIKNGVVTEGLSKVILDAFETEFLIIPNSVARIEDKSGLAKCESNAERAAYLISQGAEIAEAVKWVNFHYPQADDFEAKTRLVADGFIPPSEFGSSF